jgi:hypothetical protein
MVAVCAGLALAATRGGPVPEKRGLEGKTSRGGPISITFVDGKLDDFRTQVSAWCPRLGRRLVWEWARGYGTTAEFMLAGPRFVIAEQAENRNHKPPTTTIVELRGRLSEDGKSARGRVLAFALRGTTTCEGTASFSAG